MTRIGRNVVHQESAHPFRSSRSLRSEDLCCDVVELLVRIMVWRQERLCPCCASRRKDFYRVLPAEVVCIGRIPIIAGGIRLHQSVERRFLSGWRRGNVDWWYVVHIGVQESQ